MGDARSEDELTRREAHAARIRAEDQVIVDFLHVQFQDRISQAIDALIEEWFAGLDEEQSRGLEVALTRQLDDGIRNARAEMNAVIARQVDALVAAEADGGRYLPAPEEWRCHPVAPRAHPRPPDPAAPLGVVTVGDHAGSAPGGDGGAQ